MRTLNADCRITPSTELFEVNVGLVSGENDFFVISKESMEEHDLHHHVLPIVSKAGQVKGLVFSNEDFEEAVTNNKRVFLFCPDDKASVELTASERCYIEYGEKRGFHNNYKCRIRKHWYIVPRSWCADAFFIRQANGNPRIILNEANVNVTDTLHKIRFNENINGKLVAAAFINSYTLALSETMGRSYGGGVLTFEPGEVRKLRIPMIGANELDLSLIDNWQRDGGVNKILDYVDSTVLRDGLKLNESEIKLLRRIWCKLRDRRINRKSTR